MSESRRKSRSKENILRAAERCIYCGNAPFNIEHMPPRSMFIAKSRPNGLEFAACESCNNGTKGADVVASIFARISPQYDVESKHLVREIESLMYALDRDAPGVRETVFREENAKTQWFRERSGVIVPKIVLRAESPLLKAHMAVFAAKMGMALYREHVGSPLPLEGAVYVEYFLNSGLSEQQAHAFLSILPMHTTLKQGKFEVYKQFAYSYNCDEKTIIAALIGFHKNLHVFVIATSTPDMYMNIFQSKGSGEIIRPGNLLSRLALRKD